MNPDDSEEARDKMKDVVESHRLERRALRRGDEGRDGPGR